MKRNDNGDFCVLYVEPNDDKAELVRVVQGIKKPTVIMLSEHSQVFQRPEDFSTLKHVKRQLGQPIVFVIPSGGHLTQLASRNGFPVYLSMEALVNALAVGQFARQRTLSRPLEQTNSTIRPQKTIPLTETRPITETKQAPKKTVPLRPLDEDFTSRITAPLPPFTATYEIPLPPPSRQADKKEPGGFIKVLLIMAIIAITIAGISTFFVFSHKLPDTTKVASTPSPAGRVAFLSSNQLSENSSQGIADQVLIDLYNVSGPASQKSYYAWLLSDKSQSDMKALLLGVLPVDHGHAHLFYPGDGQHTNLLLTYSRFLVTEEDATVKPLTPSPDYTAWRYYGEIPQVPINAPDNTQHYSYLDHLRHLLASDPTLDQMELPGGLNNWLYNNTNKVLEWATSTREPWEDSQDIGFVRRQTVRILDYLDGTSYVQQDLPPNTALLVNERTARIGLLSVAGPNQDPPGYLTHIVNHLNGLLESPGAPGELRKNVADVVTALSDVEFWLNQLHHDAQQIVKMSDAQMRNPSTLTLINDMIDCAQNAYVGHTDPVSGQMQEGVNWIHDQIQHLATFNVALYTGGAQSIQLIENKNQTKTT